jgi:hypothetical protein
MRENGPRLSVFSWIVALAFALQPGVPGWSHAECVQAPEGIVAWWPAEDNADDIVDGNDGVVVGGTTFEEGEVGEAFRFSSGATGRVEVPASEGIDVGTGSGLTIELWVNPDSNAAREPLIEWNRQSGTLNWGVHLWLATSNLDAMPRPGNVYVNLVDTGGNSHILYSADGFVSAGVFQHIAVTYEKASGVARLYHQGVVIAESNLGSFTPQTSYDLFFASRPGPNEPTSFHGSIDEVSLYDRVLSADEILELKDAGSSGKCEALCGDAIRDWVVRAGDALFILRTAVGTATCDLCVCDVNNSGDVSASDALSTLRYSVGVAVVLSCPPCGAG